ncbi:sodium-dependent bicarbonate transport family permease [Mesorhizobium sp. YIM 152430]|uniref:sodium-dependent bicarbonate transport family permease n=1 Tax=Mesorhizobium sp. YIM 152430 TaxID=3031761 RepID=UPI0023DCC14A|nr:sodium-dependent bicarbonate transport family permease [Mesorhizobium sp. YIM 152430]MDF1600256.1 sodium-dependent bicarbonate transport family permease [Mesorhizobium sp. YIM 152430]
MLSQLLSPIILFFVLGMAAGFGRSDLSVPEQVAKGLSLYLMAAIGLKGGIEVAEVGFSSDMLIAAGVGMVLSCALPLPAFWMLQKFGRIDRINAAAVSAHYGSVSVVTFVTAVEILPASGLSAEGYMVAVMALMETPAIVVGLMLARSRGFAKSGSQTNLVRETLLNGSVVMLAGSFAVGLTIGPSGFASIAPVFESGFRGLLCLFLLDMGLVAARRLRGSQVLTPRMVALAIFIPVFNGTIGVLAGTIAGLDPGSVAILGTLAGSASYIAVPAAMRLALPEADPGIYLTMSLAITFPFNLTLGIPFYTIMASGLQP